MARSFRVVCTVLAFSVASIAWCQERDRAVEPAPPPNPPKTESHSHIFGVIPNYRTYPSLLNYKPLTTREKFEIAVKDALDPGTFVMAAAFAGERQWTKTTPSFGQGVAGYARYFGTAYGDFVIGDFMTEAVMPTMLHQDPRYFRRGTGSGFSRVLYAMGQIFWTHTDSGRRQFNFSEIGGNAAAAAISTAYYPENRNTGEAASSLGVQVGIDMAGNILKEFWPDLRKVLTRKPNATTPKPNATTPASPPGAK